jgi:hypothetical protein
MAVTWQDAEQDAGANRTDSSPTRTPKRTDLEEDAQVVRDQGSTPTITNKSSESGSAGRKETRARTFTRRASRAFTRRASTFGASIPINSRFVSFWRPNSNSRSLLLRVGACPAGAGDGLLAVASLGFGGKEHLVTVESEDYQSMRPAVKLPYHQEDALVLRVFRGGTGERERERPVGEAVLRLVAVGSAEKLPLSFRADVQLLDASMDLAGVLPVEVAWQGLESREAADGWCAQLAPARITRNLWAGVLADVLDGEVAAFKTYRVALHGVAAVFGDVWSANYDEKHAKIFAEGAQGEVIRAAIQTEHSALYGSSSVGGTVSRALGRKGRRKMEYLSTSQDFLRMIKCGVHRGSMRVYTFVILDSGLFFSETGARMARDVLSKHALHANAEARVRYAGTFRCVFTKGQDMIIVVDNDSGTYRPAGEHLELVRKIFQINFPGLQVVGLDVLQPQPDDTRLWVGPAEVLGRTSRPKAVYNGKWVWQPLLTSTVVLLAKSRLWWCLRSKRARRVAVPAVPEKPPPPCRELPTEGALDQEDRHGSRNNWDDDRQGSKLTL